MKNEIIELAKKLIAFKTITGNTKEIADCFDFIKEYLAPEIKSGKIIAKEYEKNGVLSLVLANYDSLDYDVLLNGHIDVVVAEDKDFNPIIKNSKLYARGAADMKSQVATMIIVLKELANNNAKKSIALILNSDEEIGGKNGAGYLMKDIGYRGKVAIMPDGGENFELNIKEKGVFWVKITSAGKASHGSRPWLGENAILKSIKFYQELEKKFPPLKKISSSYQDGISMNLGKIQGGKSVNAVPENAEFYLDFRYSEKIDKKKIIAEIKNLTKKYKFKLKIIEDMDISVTSPENLYLKKFRNITEKTINRKIKITKSTGSSGSRFFSAKNIPVIITSPNYGNIHGASEWVEIKSLIKFYTILKTFLRSI